jgi:hypothetical protein
MQQSFFARSSKAPVELIATNSKVIPTNMENIEVLIAPMRSLSVKENMRTAIAPIAKAKIPALVFFKKDTAITTMNKIKAIKSNFNTPFLLL